MRKLPKGKQGTAVRSPDLGPEQNGPGRTWAMLPAELGVGPRLRLQPRALHRRARGSRGPMTCFSLKSEGNEHQP